MKELILITIVFASCLILITDISIASDYASESEEYQDAVIPSVMSYGTNTDDYASEYRGFQDTTIRGATANAETLDDISNAQLFHSYINREHLNKCGGFLNRLSYSGPCNIFPKTVTCLIYSDNYKWIVPDIRIDLVPICVGVSNCKSIELIRCYDADYYHILGTSLVMSIPRTEKILRAIQ